MSDTHEYVWRSFSGLFRRSRVVIDFANREVEFHNAIPPNGFFNLFYQRFVLCPFSDVTDVDAYTQNDTRCLQVKTKHGSCVYLEGPLRDFSAFVADFQAVIAEK